MCYLAQDTLNAADAARKENLAALETARKELAQRQATHAETYVKAVQQVAEDWKQAWVAIKGMKSSKTNVEVCACVCVCMSTSSVVWG